MPQDEEDLIARIVEVLSRQRATQSEPPGGGQFDYWGPGGLVKGLPVAPGPDYFRLVPDDSAAEAALEAGEMPVVLTPDRYEMPGFGIPEFEQVRVPQWEGETRAFGVDRITGRPTRVWPGGSFLPVHDFETDIVGSHAKPWEGFPGIVQRRTGTFR